MIRPITVVAFAAFLLGATTASAQPQPPAGQPSSAPAFQIPSELTQTKTPNDSPRSPSAEIIRAHERSFYVALAVLAFGTLILVLESFIILKTNVNWDAFAVLRLFGLTLILTAGMFLISAGYSQDQLAAMMGLLGTVAGYLLGKEGSTTERSVAAQNAETEG
ncbi:MAG: hypothetical protein U0930_24375 [Pirellulales bacterium]